MSNLLIIAQATQSTDAGTSYALLSILLLPALLSALSIARWRLYTIPPVPDDEGPTSPYLVMSLAISALVFIGVIQLMALLMGITPDNAKNPESMQKLLLCPPAAQCFTAGIILILMTPYLPRIFSWQSPQRFLALKAITGYLLAIPWVILCGVLGAWLASRFAPEAKTVHPIFEAWRTGGHEIALFKASAIFSSVISAPLAEELFFRGLAQRLVYRLSSSAPLAIVLSSMAFASIHSPWTIQAPVFILSLFLGWAYFRTGNILVPILMHAVFNGLQFVWFLLAVPATP